MGRLPEINCEFFITSVYPVHNAPVPLLTSPATVVVNDPRSCWPDVIQKKKIKKEANT